MLFRPAKHPATSQFIDLTGRRFGRLAVNQYVKIEKGQSRQYGWLCECACGSLTVVLGHNLRAGTTVSCGCYSRDQSIKHGYCIDRKSEKFKIHRVWSEMIQRCTNPNCDRYKYYGARGIAVCSRWRGKDGFAKFITDMGDRPSNHLLERRRNDGPYSPENCYWATKAEQARNTRQNVVIKYAGKEQCLKDWADDLEIPYKTLHLRIRRYGWTTERAFTTAVRKRKR